MEDIAGQVDFPQSVFLFANMKPLNRPSAPPPRTGDLRGGSTPLEINQTAQALVQEFPNDLFRQIRELYSRISLPSAIGRGVRKGRQVSHRTLCRHFESTRKLILTLGEMNIHPRNLSEMSVKHVRLAVQHWENSGCAPGTLATRYSCLKRLYLLAFGKELPPVKEFLVNKTAATREYSAVKPKDWESNGVDVNQKVQMAQSICPQTAMMLKLSSAFGLRLLECLELRPREADLGNHLLINRGAKGGRGRVIPIETDMQRQVLDEAKQLAHPRWGFLAKTKDLAKNRRHAYYVLNEIGVSRRGDGVTFHGLRHQYVHECFERLTGVEAPVRGGEKLDKTTRQAVALELMERTGHGRANVATAYLGSHRHLAHVAKRNMQQWIQALEGNPVLQDWALTHLQPLRAQGLNASLLMVGPQAEGKVSVEDMNFPLLLRIQVWPQQGATQMLDLISSAQAVFPQAVGRPCFVSLETDADTGASLEVLGTLATPNTPNDRDVTDQDGADTQDPVLPSPASLHMGAQVPYGLSAY